MISIISYILINQTLPYLRAITQFLKFFLLSYERLMAQIFHVWVFDASAGKVLHRLLLLMINVINYDNMLLIIRSGCCCVLLVVQLFVLF